MDDRQGGGEPEMILQFDVQIRLRDGVATRADVYRPKTEGRRYPVILQRTPYDKAGPLAGAFSRVGFIAFNSRNTQSATASASRSYPAGV